MRTGSGRKRTPAVRFPSPILSPAGRDDDAAATGARWRGGAPLHSVRQEPTSIFDALNQHTTAMARDPSSPATYADAGVDIDAGNALVEGIRPLVRTTRRIGADGEIGGFGGLFDLA